MSQLDMNVKWTVNNWLYWVVTRKVVLTYTGV